MIIKEKIEKILEKQNEILKKAKLVLSNFEENLSSLFQNLIIDFEKIFDLDNNFKLKISTKNQPYISIIKEDKELNLIEALERYPKDIFSLLVKSNFMTAILEALDNIEKELEKLEHVLDDLNFEKKVRVEVAANTLEKVKDAQIKVVEDIKEVETLTEEKQFESELKASVDKSSAEKESTTEIPSFSENIEQVEAIQEENKDVSSQENQVADTLQDKEISSKDSNASLETDIQNIQEDLPQKELQEEGIEQTDNTQKIQVETSKFQEQVENLSSPDENLIQETQSEQITKEISQEEILLKYSEDKLKAYEEELNKVIKSLKSTPEIMPAIQNNEGLRSILKSRLVKIPADVFKYLLDRIEINEDIKQILTNLRE